MAGGHGVCCRHTCKYMHVRITTLQRVHSRMQQEQKMDQDLWCGRRRRHRDRREGTLSTNLPGPYVSNQKARGPHTHLPCICDHALISVSTNSVKSVFIIADSSSSSSISPILMLDTATCSRTCEDHVNNIM